MIIPQLALSLSRHPSLCLEHMIGIIMPALVTLRGIEILKVRTGVWTIWVEVAADGGTAMMHSWTCQMLMAVANDQ